MGRLVSLLNNDFRLGFDKGPNFLFKNKKTLDFFGLSEHNTIGISISKFTRNNVYLYKEWFGKKKSNQSTIKR